MELFKRILIAVFICIFLFIRSFVCLSIYMTTLMIVCIFKRTTSVLLTRRGINFGNLIVPDTLFTKIFISNSVPGRRAVDAND